MKNSIVIILMMLYGTGFSQSNIDNVLSNVLKNNKTLIANTQLLEAKKLDYKTGLTPENPKVQYDYMIGSPAGAGNQTNFDVSQAFDFPTAYTSKKKMSNELIAKSELELNAIRQAILLEAKMNCLHLIYLNKRQVELKRRVNSMTQLYQNYQSKLKNGEATILDVNKSQLLLLNLNTELKLNESDIKRYNSKLTELNGGNPLSLNDTTYTISTELPEFTKMDSLIEANDMLLKVYGKEKDVSMARVKVIKGMSLPKIETGYHSQFILGQKYQGAHLGLSIPLWENKNRIKAEKASVLVADYLIAQHLTEHYYENQQLYEKYVALKNSLTEYQTIFSSTKNTEILDKALKAGNISRIEYFMELTYFYNAYDKYLEAEKMYQETIAQLNKYQL
jgi:outer membrane protein, heavy metal efflux system